MMKKNSEQLGLLKKSGYSDKAIEYFINKLNVGMMENPSVSCAYTGPCGDTMQIYLKINDGQITDAKFQAIGCAAAHASGSALMEIVRGKSLEEAEELSENEIIDYLGGLPIPKFHCACLAKRTLEQTIEQYRKTAGSGKKNREALSGRANP